MAESGGAPGILGTDSESTAESSTPEISTALDPTAAALAAEVAKNNPQLAQEASAYFRKQSRLVEIQTEHLHEQRAVNLQLLKLKRFDERLRVSLRMFVILVATVVGIGAVIFIRDAITDHGLVVEAFSVPPDMSRDGLTGEVVATRFMDKLQALQAATVSDRPADSYLYNWGSDIKVEIPETGLSLSEVSKLIRDRFGHSSRIAGEVIRTPTGIALTARFGDLPPATFTGPEGDFDALAGKAAEAVYRTSQLYRFAQFLSGQNRNAEAFSVIAGLATEGPQKERSWAYVELGMLDMYANGDLERARRHCLRGLAYAGAITTSAEICLVGEEVWSGHDEKDFEYSRSLEIAAHERAPGTTEDFFENSKIMSTAWLDTISGDFQKSVEDWTLGEAAPDYLETAKVSSAMVATAYAMDHDPDSAKKIVRALEPNDDPSFLQPDAIAAFNALPTYWIAATSNEWPAALIDARACDSWLEMHAAENKLFAHLRLVWIQPLEALAMARSQDVGDAESLVSATPLDCYLCVRVRGQVAATKRDWPTSEHWFSEAVRQAPTLPFAFSEWGNMLLSKGDFDGAIAKFQSAHQKSPHFADALKGWGDALLGQGKAKAALKKFNEALAYAPNWKELKEAQEVASKQRT